MKKFFILLWTCWFVTAGNAQFTKASLEASGVTCSLCSKAIKKALEGLSFVQEVKVNVKAQDYNLVFKENSTVHFNDIQKAVEDAGFSIASLKVTCYFDNVKLQKDENIRIGDQTFNFLNGNNEILNGEKTFTIIDKSFLTPKAFKKYSAIVKQNAISNIRIYHVII
ncbi:MAG TPA: heavy-metal-associated domain-containing protein [Chitinophagaceae bacterium]|jgi:copper chaperone CopZ|nr:heavy-metal-associated domain-containing protein [Chitinophagaceae bacterium]